jgi:hypothetical protein
MPAAGFCTPGAGADCTCLASAFHPSPTLLVCTHPQLFSGVTQLDLSHCKGVDEATFAQLLRACPQLQQLRLPQSPCWVDPQQLGYLQVLPEAAPHLVVLQVSAKGALSVLSTCQSFGDALSQCSSVAAEGSPGEPLSSCVPSSQRCSCSDGSLAL